MANAQDYFDYLADQIGISTANSQEELNAAQTLADLMKEHGVETSVEEFDTSSFARLPYAVLTILLFVATLLAGIGGAGLAVVGALIAALCVAPFVLEYLGTEIFANVGPSARSQNVVAMHEASGPLVAKGNRPIVIAAHYDSPRESFLYSSGISKYLPMIYRAAPWCVLAAGVSSIFQILLFFPEPFRRVIWVLGILAAVVPLVVGVGSIVERFSSCSLGANDNKASVAALLGVLEEVFPAGSADDIVARIAQKRRERAKKPEAVRHGEEVLRSLGVLPEECEIVYVDEPEPEEEPDFGATSDLASIDDAEDDASATAVTAPVLQEVPEPEDASDETRIYRPQVADVARRAALFDLPDPSEEEGDPFASFEAPAQRPALLDRLNTANERNARRIQDSLAGFDDEPDGLDAPVPDYSAAAEEEPEAPAPAQEAPARKRFSLFGRKKQEEESLSDFLGVEDDYDAKTGGRQIGSWEELEAQDEEFSRRRKSDPRWKGGAAASEELREGEDAPAQEELAEAAASLGLDELLCHDIWFVALGANGLDHAGMKAFIAKHRPQLRGAFIVNLDCVGAGELSIVTAEGLFNTRRADRRISRLLKGAANDLNVELGETRLDWRSTDATPAMRSSMRAATIMGVSDAGLPALSRTPDDVDDNVDPSQIATVANLVTELIRRS